MHTREELKKLYSAFLRIAVSEKLGGDPHNINERDAFFTLGVSSLISSEILNLLNVFFGNLSATLLFEYPNIDKLSAYLAALPVDPGQLIKIKERVSLHTGLQPGDVSPLSGKKAADNAAPGNACAAFNQHIAVIGMSGRFPGAGNPYRFFSNLAANRDCVAGIPENRWSCHELFSDSPGEKNRIYSKWGGFIDDIDQFDALFFKIPPSEAELMDPQQKLFLECSWEALEDAGYGKTAEVAGKRVGVYAGVTWNEFSLLANEHGYLEDLYKGPGTLYWSIPNRVSYFFDFTGPSICIDTACSSSLVAIHLACHGLFSGDCEMALAGGINLNLHPAKYLFLSRNNFLSADGKCRSFGEGGGTVMCPVKVPVRFY